MPPKFRDPDNPSNRWSGRGSKPVWLTKKLQRGHSLADFLIPGLAKLVATPHSQIGRRTVFKVDRDVAV